MYQTARNKNINTNVLIKLNTKTEEKTAGGIIIPDTAKEKPKEGEVVSIATGASEEISVGDYVIYDVRNQDAELL